MKPRTSGGEKMNLVFRRSARHALTACALSLGLGAALNAWAEPAKAVPPELPAETLGLSTLEGRPTSRVYVADVAISHISDEIGRASCRKECRSRWSPY